MAPIRKFISRPQWVYALPMIAVCVACSVAILWPILTTPNWYRTNQAYRYPYLLNEFKQQFLAGYWYPRWVPKLLGGYGYPTFIYYPPGFWFFALPFALLIPSVVVASKAALVALLMLGGIGMFRLANTLCNRGCACIVTMIFYLSPYLAYQLYVKGSFSEMAGTLVCPWVFFYLLNTIDALQQQKPCFRSGVGLALSATALIFAHQIVTIWAAFAALFFVAYGAFECKNLRRYGLVFVLIAVLTLALSASYWYSALSLKDWVLYARGMVLKGPTSANSIPLRSLFWPRSNLDGCVLPVLCMGGLVMSWRSPLAKSTMMCLGVMLFYVLTVSTLKIGFPQLLFLQQSFRLFSVAATVQCIGICLLAKVATQKWGSRAVLICGLLALALLFHNGANQYRLGRVHRDVDYDIRLHQRNYYDSDGSMNFDIFSEIIDTTFDDMTHTKEFMPREAHLAGLKQRFTNHLAIVALGEPFTPEFCDSHDTKISTPQNALSLQTNCLTIISNKNDLDVVFDIANLAPTTLSFRQFYFPGWKVAIDGTPIALCPPADVAAISPSYCWDTNGLIQIRLTAMGSHRVHVWYEGPPDADLRNLIALAVIAFSLAWLRRLNQKM